MLNNILERLEREKKRRKTSEDKWISYNINYKIITAKLSKYLVGRKKRKDRCIL